MSHPRRGTPVLYLCILLVVALFLAVACGPAATPTPKPTPTPTKAAVVTPTPTATPAPAVPKGPTGKAVLAKRVVEAPNADPGFGTYNVGILEPYGIGESLFMYDTKTEDPMTPMLASSWEIAPDGKSVTIKIKKGIPFYTPPITPGLNYGELTADDVVFSMNRVNSATNPKSIVGGPLAGYLGEATVVDSYTLQVPLVQPVYFGLPLSEFVILDTGLNIQSKKALELLGPDRLKDVAVATGPMVQKEWITNERGTVEAVPRHWFETSKIATFTVIQVPEVASRIAMLEAGQIDMAEMDFGKTKLLREKGMVFMPTMSEKDTENASVIWPCNLWETVHARTGAALEPWKGPCYEKDYPWLGNPWGTQVPYTDTDNPPGMSDMEQARIVRWALSYAINRDAIVEKLQGGLGTPIYIEYMGPLYPGWDPNRTVTADRGKAILVKHGCTGADCKTYGVETALPGYLWPWKIPYDPKKAEELLDKAGYPKKAGGIRFEISLNKYVCETGEVCLEQADAVAAGWEAVGVKTTLLTEDYGAVVSQRMRRREQLWPVVKNCSVESANNPLDWPMPPADNSVTRPGWGCAFEDLFSAMMYKKINSERSKANREEWHLDVTDWMYYWQLYSGVAQQPRGVAANPKRVKSWNSRPSQSGSWHSPQAIELVGQ